MAGFIGSSGRDSQPAMAVSDRVPEVGFSELSQTVVVLLGAFFTLSSVVSLGIGSLSISGITFSDTVATLAGLDLTYALMFSVIAVVLGYASSNKSWDDFSDIQSYLAYAVIISLFIQFASPDLSSWIINHDMAAYTVFVLQLAGFSVMVGWEDIGESGGGR